MMAFCKHFVLKTSLRFFPCIIMFISEKWKIIGAGFNTTKKRFLTRQIKTSMKSYGAQLTRGIKSFIDAMRHMQTASKTITLNRVEKNFMKGRWSLDSARRSDLSAATSNYENTTGSK